VAAGKAVPARRGRWDRGSGVGGATGGRKAMPARRERRDRGGCAGSGTEAVAWAAGGDSQVGGVP
jgi:hypothetical protein